MNPIEALKADIPCLTEDFTDTGLQKIVDAVMRAIAMFTEQQIRDTYTACTPVGYDDGGVYCTHEECPWEGYKWVEFDINHFVEHLRKAHE